MLRRLREIDPTLPEDAAASTEARILDYGERDVVRAGGRPIRRRSVSPELKRYVVLVAACVLTAASVWAWTQPRTSATRTAGAELAPSPTASAIAGITTNGPAPSLTAAPTPSPASLEPSASASGRSPLAGIYVADGWVRRIDVPLGTMPDIGPVSANGKIYVGGLVLDRDGQTVHPGPGNVPQVLDEDGNAYGVDNDQETATIWATTTDGSPIFSYSLQVQAHVDLFAGKGSLLALYADLDESGTQVTRILDLARDGTVLAGWYVPFPLRLTQGKPQLAIRPDGSLLAEVVRSDGCSTNHYTPDGRLVSTIEGCWESLTQSDDGTLVGWTCLDAHEAGGCARSSVAVLTGDGGVARGWPKTYAGTTSIPAIGPQGIYFVLTPDPIAATTVVGMTRAGKPLRGWPVALDRDAGTRDFDGCQCRVPPSPVVGSRSGVVMLQTDYDLMSWDAEGRILETWPTGSEAGALFASPIYTDVGGKPILFAAAGDRIQAIDASAQKPLVGLFVDRGANKVAWLGWRPMPDGGIVAFTYHASDRESYVVVARLEVST